jgi:uncharacterized protein YndB with AHSA1/START domain
MHDRIEHEVHILAPIERVWSLLTIPENVARWYAFDGAEIDLRPQGALIFRWKEHGAFRGRIERVSAPTYLAFRFVGHVPDVEPQEGNSTLVEFHLEERDGGTLVRVVERGFSTLIPPNEGGTPKALISLDGWRAGFASLRAHAEA